MNTRYIAPQFYMRSILLISAVLLLMFPSMVRFEKVVYFYANRTAIAKELCENKNVKGSCCKGSCVLKKALKNTSDEKPFHLPSYWKVKTEWMAEEAISVRTASPSPVKSFGSQVNALISQYQPRELSEPPVLI